jgi:TPR repeat protein
LSKDYSLLSDYVNAEKWFTLAAEQGSDEAQYKLGRIYHTGVGPKADLKLAFEWYRKAAEQGNMKGEYQVGLFYHKGLFVEQNNMEAEMWYQKSADQGYGPASQRLEE